MTAAAVLILAHVDLVVDRAPSRDRVLAAADRAVAAAGWGDRPLGERMAAKRRLLDHFDKAVR